MEPNATFCFKKDCILCIFDKYYSVLQQLLFDGNPGVIIAIGCVTNDRLRESPPPGKCKHNVLVVFDC